MPMIMNGKKNIPVRTRSIRLLYWKLYFLNTVINFRKWEFFFKKPVEALTSTTRDFGMVNFWSQLSIWTRSTWVDKILKEKFRGLLINPE